MRGALDVGDVGEGRAALAAAVAVLVVAVAVAAVVPAVAVGGRLRRTLAASRGGTRMRPSEITVH